jgi:hypothetical protein
MVLRAARNEARRLFCYPKISMQRLIPSVLMAALVLLVWCANAQTGTTKKAPVKKGTPTKSTSKSPAKKGSTTSTSSKKSAGKKGTSRKTAVTWRNRQLSPTPDRYREIQSALAAKGYLKSEDATGTWGPDSIDALKRFQQEQNLEPSGKINSLSLIALGLGPKRETTASAVPPPKPPQ